jgi:hypothetical protein
MANDEFTVLVLEKETGRQYQPGKIRRKVQVMRVD